MHNYFTNYHTATCFDTIVSSSDSLQPIPCQVTPVFQMQLSVIQFTIQIFHTGFIILYCDQQMHSHFTNSHTLDSVETCRSVIICEIIVHLLVIEQNKIKEKQLVERLAFGKFREKDSARKLWTAWIRWQSVSLRIPYPETLKNCTWLGEVCGLFWTGKNCTQSTCDEY